MRGLGGHRLGSACLALAAGLMTLLVFATPSAVADPPAWVAGTIPANATVEATSIAGAIFTYTDPTATDQEGDPLVLCIPGSGSSFPLGVTTVTCTATDVLSGSSEQVQTSFTVTVVDTTPPNLSVPGDVQAEATSAAGATVTYGSASAVDLVDGAIVPTCAPLSGASFPLGATTVACTATDTHGNSRSATFKVVVADTTAPTLSGVSPNITGVQATSSAGAAVTYPLPTATDAVDPSPTVSCSPASGGTFPLGTTTVSCSARDHASPPNPSPAKTFTVTVEDTTAPVLGNVPANVNVAASGPSGASVTYALPTASDNVDKSPVVTCSPPPAGTFPLGTTTVTCTAIDSSGNRAATATFTITVSDKSAPVLAGLASRTAEATSSAGAVVTFAVTASDNVDPSPTVSCSPASGNTFPLGTTKVSCTASDHASPANTSAAQFFNVTVVDTTAPKFSIVPAPPVYEANSSGGTAVAYKLPTAVDLVSGPIPAVTCSPGSGNTFPIGSTTVSCTARDGAGNIGSTTFKVIVADRTPPVISAPPGLTLYATTPEGIPAGDPSLVEASTQITAADLIDPSPAISSDMPTFLRLGHTLVHFYATDKYGNRAGVNMDVQVLARPPGNAPTLPKPDATPPDNVANLSARPGNGAVVLSWKPPNNADFDHVTVSRSSSGSADLGTRVYTGKATKYTDKGLTNDVEYRYVVVSFDKTGNRSVGLAILVTPLALKLTHPLDGATLKSPPLLAWQIVGEADYYNVQLFRESGKSLSSTSVENAAKILSVWPTRTRFALKKAWKFAGRTYRLTPGVYRWFVWPGFGTPSQGNYGQLLGQSTFTVRR